MSSAASRQQPSSSSGDTPRSPLNAVSQAAAAVPAIPVSQAPVGPSAKRIRRASVVLLAALVVAFGGWIGWAVATHQPLDYAVYYVAGTAVARGESPYTLAKPAWRALAAHDRLYHVAWPYRYPPYTAALFRALQPLGGGAVEVGWLAANAAAMILAAWLIARALGGGRLVPLALGLLLALAPAYDTLMVGQINGLLLLTLALAFWALVRKRDTLLGASLAAGVALKIVPLALVAWLVWRRRWRALLATAAALALLSLAALPLVGAHGFADYARHAVDLTRPNLVFNGATNTTFVGAAGRLLPAHLMLARSIGRGLDAGLLVATVALVIVPSRRPSRSVEGPSRAALEFALIVAALPLLPPFTWIHQLVTILVPLLVLAAWYRPADATPAAGIRARLRPPAWAVMAALLVLTDLTWFIWAILGRLGVQAPSWFYALSFVTLFPLAVWAACAGALYDMKWGARAVARAPLEQRGASPSRPDDGERALA